MHRLPRRASLKIVAATVAAFALAITIVNGQSIAGAATKPTTPESKPTDPETPSGLAEPVFPRPGGGPRAIHTYANVLQFPSRTYLLNTVTGEYRKLPYYNLALSPTGAPSRSDRDAGRAAIEDHPDRLVRGAHRAGRQVRLLTAATRNRTACHGYGERVHIGFGVPVSGSWATRDNMIHVARRAEELGYHSLWTFQRLLASMDVGGREMYRSVQDAIVPLAFLAGLTERVRLGTAVVNLPFVSPVVLAKELTTLDILSGGRLDLGLGLGWSDDEFIATGARKQRRGRQADEYLEVLKTLWTDEVVEYAGTFYRVPRTRAEPKPVQRPHPPILLGGDAPAALRRAGRLAGGWVSGSRADLRAIGQAVATVRAAAEEAGRDPSALRFVCRVPAKVRPAGSPERGPATGTLDEIRADLDDLVGQGVTEAFIDLNFDPQIGSPQADPAESMRRADEVLEALAPGR